MSSSNALYLQYSSNCNLRDTFTSNVYSAVELHSRNTALIRSQQASLIRAHLKKISREEDTGWNAAEKVNNTLCSKHVTSFIWRAIKKTRKIYYSIVCPGGREAHLQQCGGQFARPFAEPCGCQRCCFQTRRWYSRSGCSPQCRCRRTWGFWGSFQTSSAVSGRRDADVPSSALHLCEQTMWDPQWCERRGT